MNSKTYPRTNDRQTVYLNTVIGNPMIEVGDYTIYNDFVNDPTQFEKNNVLYHYPINKDRLVIGKFCSIACGARFLFNAANHTLGSLSTYPFPIFFEEWGLPTDADSIARAWDNHGDIVVGNDVVDRLRGRCPRGCDHWRRRYHRQPRRGDKGRAALYHCGRHSGQAHPQAL